MAQRPTGVTILGVLMIIGAVLGIIGSLIAIGLASALAAGLGALIALAVVIPLIIAVVQLIVGVGLLKLMPWAWMAAIVITAISAVFSLIGLISGGSTASNIITLVVDGIILWYLFRPDVKAVFGRA